MFESECIHMDFAGKFFLHITMVIKMFRNFLIFYENTQPYYLF